MIALAAARRERHLAIYALVLPAVFALGVARFSSARPQAAADAIARYNDGVAMRVRGVLRDDPDIGDTSQRFVVDTREVQVRGAWQPASGGVLVRSGVVPRYRSGDIVEAEGKVESPPRLGGFDYADYLQRRGIGSVMQFPSLRLAGREDDGIVRATVLAVRRRLSHAIAVSLPEPQASLAQGVLLGQRSALPADVAANLNATNTSHLVVVSGSNVVLVSAFATIAFAWAFGRRRALALSIAAVVAYAMLVGASPPVMRATIMGILLIVAQLAGRPSSGLTAILLAAAVMSGIDPSITRDVSFQLSFAATAGIVYLASPVRAWTIEWAARVLRRDGLPRALDQLIAGPLSVTLAAIVATEPLIALNFGRVSLVAIPANMLVVPAFGLILGASLVAALGGMLPAWHLVFAAPAYYALTYWLVLARSFASMPHAYSQVGGYTSPWAATTYAALGALAFAALRLAGRPPGGRITPSRGIDLRRLSPVAAFALPVTGLIVSAGFMFWPSPPRRLEVTVLDVGEGDAILIRTPAGQDILVDGGPGRAVLRGLGDELPWYDRSIEMMLLTHPQADHMTGLLDVLDRYDVRRVLAGPGVDRSTTYGAWLDAVRAEGTSVETVRQGRVFDLDYGVRIEVLGPDPVEAVDPQVNNTGAVLRVSWRDVSFLLPADIEAMAERALLTDGADLRATVLKVPHHGSKTSSTRAFLDAVRPSYAVVSSGKDNAFGHPAPEVVDRLDDYAQVFNTPAPGRCTSRLTANSCGCRPGSRIWGGRQPAVTLTGWSATSRSPGSSSKVTGRCCTGTGSCGSGFRPAGTSPRTKTWSRRWSARCWRRRASRPTSSRTASCWRFRTCRSCRLRWRSSSPTSRRGRTSTSI